MWRPNPITISLVWSMICQPAFALTFEANWIATHTVEVIIMYIFCSFRKHLTAYSKLFLKLLDDWNHLARDATSLERIVELLPWCSSHAKIPRVGDSNSPGHRRRHRTTGARRPTFTNGWARVYREQNNRGRAWGEMADRTRPKRSLTFQGHDVSKVTSPEDRAQSLGGFLLVICWHQLRIMQRFRDIAPQSGPD